MFNDIKVDFYYNIFFLKKSLRKQYDYASLVNDRKGRINIFRIFKNGDKKIYLTYLYICGVLIY